MSMFGQAMASPSLADIAAVTGNGRNNNDGGFGDGNGWWVLIILFALFGGWGNNGYGNGRNNGGDCGGKDTVVVVPPTGGGYGMNSFGFTDAAMQRGFDNQTVINKLDGINSGICALGYDQLNQMNGISTQIMQGNFGLQQAINNDTVTGTQNVNALSRQLSECCCDNRAAIKDLQYNMATQFCSTNTNIHQTGDAIINSQNQGFNMLNQTIKDGFCNLEMKQMQRENADLRQRLNNCDRDAALQGTASYIINSVRPTPIPAWPVQNPWAGCNCNSAFFNNNGCGSSSCCA